MGYETSDYEKDYEDMIKGSISLGNLQFMWDFTNMLSKQQYINKEKWGGHPMYKTDTGRIIIPSMNIF